MILVEAVDRLRERVLGLCPLIFLRIGRQRLLVGDAAVHERFNRMGDVELGAACLGQRGGTLERGLRRRREVDSDQDILVIHESCPLGVLGEASIAAILESRLAESGAEELDVFDTISISSTGMELLLIRHGLPIHKVNSDGTPADPPLSDLGREQARLVGEWLAEERIDRIYSSPMLRARETAEPLARFMNVKIELEPRVREFDADAVEYIPMEKLKRDHPERWREFVAGGYASQTDFAAFVSTVTTGLQQLIDANAGRRIAVFCHGGVINSWATHILGMTPRLFLDAGYASVSRFLAASSGEHSISSLNEVAHLRDLKHAGAPR